MNKLFKTIIAIFGACDVIFTILTPVLISLTVINVIGWSVFGSTWHSWILVVVAILSMLYRAIRVGLMKGDKPFIQ